MDDHPEPQHVAPQPLAFSIGEACAISKVGRSTLCAAIQQGSLRARKCGKRTLILSDDLRAALYLRRG